jgi:hypothetical protein
MLRFEAHEELAGKGVGFFLCGLRSAEFSPLQKRDDEERTRNSSTAELTSSAARAKCRHHFARCVFVDVCFPSERNRYRLCAVVRI